MLTTWEIPESHNVGAYLPSYLEVYNIPTSLEKENTD